LEDEEGDNGMAAGDGGQADEDADNNRANFREVGHNIYILAHQVTICVFFLHEMEIVGFTYLVYVWIY